MNNKYSLKLGLVFSFVTFLIMLVTGVITAAITAIYFHLSSLPSHTLIIPIVNLYLISIIVGTTISAIIGKRILSPLVKFSETLMEVGKGNFNIKLKESKHSPDELKTMYRNYNIMVSELNNIETFRSDFIANVSHEFKTPLASIDGYTTLLKDTNLTDEEKNEYINKIHSNTQRLSNLISIILQISRLENQVIIVEKNNFKLDEQLRQTLVLLEKKWTSKNIELNLSLDEVIYYGNEELIMQIWINIFSNAIKFTPDCGSITCTLKESESWITVIISDTGIGMSKEVQHHIFDKFYQGDKSHSSEGNGLGLALVKRIVDLCKGTIEVHSEYEVGSIFTIKLPR